MSVLGKSIESNRNITKSNEYSDITNSISIKEEPLENSNEITIEYTDLISNNHTIQVKLEKENVENTITYEEFKCKNEELDLKEENDETSFIEVMSTEIPHKNSFADTVEQSNKKVKSSRPLFKCTFCEFQTKCKGYLRRHVFDKHMTDSIYKDERTYKCSSCTFTTKYKYYLKNHMVLHKSSEELEIFKCFNCGFESKHKHSLRMHMMIHIRNPKFKCDQCNFSTNRKERFTKHLLIHKNLVQ